MNKVQQIKPTQENPYLYSKLAAKTETE